VQQSIFLSTNYHFNKEMAYSLAAFVICCKRGMIILKIKVMYSGILFFEPSLCFLSHFDPSLNASMGYVELNNLKPSYFKILVNNRVSYSNAPSLELQKATLQPRLYKK
jgi:hypothetical protein